MLRYPEAHAAYSEGLKVMDCVVWQWLCTDVSDPLSLQGLQAQTSFQVRLFSFRSYEMCLWMLCRSIRMMLL